MNQNGASDNGQGFHLSHGTCQYTSGYQHPDAPNSVRPSYWVKVCDRPVITFKKTYDK